MAMPRGPQKPELPCRVCLAPAGFTQHSNWWYQNKICQPCHRVGWRARQAERLAKIRQQRTDRLLTATIAAEVAYEMRRPTPALPSAADIEAAQDMLIGLQGGRQTDRDKEIRAAAAQLLGRPICKTCGKRPGASKGDGKWRAECGWCRLKRSGRTRNAGSRHKDQCAGCGLAFSFPPFFDVDHKVQFSKGGDNSQENTWTLCPNCHRVKTLVERGIMPPETQPNAWRAL